MNIKRLKEFEADLDKALELSDDLYEKYEDHNDIPVQEEMKIDSLIKQCRRVFHTEANRQLPEFIKALEQAVIDMKFIAEGGSTEHHGDSIRTAKLWLAKYGTNKVWD